MPGHQSVTANDARNSFMKGGLWPMDYRFIQLVTTSESHGVSALMTGNMPENTVALWRFESSMSILGSKTARRRRKISN